METKKEKTTTVDATRKCWINYEATEYRWASKTDLELEIGNLRNLITDVLKCALYAACNKDDFPAIEEKRILEGIESLEQVIEVLQDAP